MAEKRQRRERLSPRDHSRARAVATALDSLLGVLEQMYPDDLELKIARPSLERFKQALAQAEAGSSESDNPERQQ